MIDERYSIPFIGIESKVHMRPLSDSVENLQNLPMQDEQLKKRMGSRNHRNEIPGESDQTL
jgi:hypothetical protein